MLCIVMTISLILWKIPFREYFDSLATPNALLGFRRDDISNNSELTSMTDLTEFVFTQVQNPKSLSCDRDTLLMYYLIWCSRVFSVFSHSVQSCWETLFASTLVIIFSNPRTELAFHLSVCWARKCSVLTLHPIFMQIMRTSTYPMPFFCHP